MLAVFQAARTRRSVKICFCLLLRGAILVAASVQRSTGEQRKSR